MDAVLGLTELMNFCVESGETKCIPTTSKNSESLFNTHSTVDDRINLENMKLNEPGRQKLGR